MSASRTIAGGAVVALVLLLFPAAATAQQPASPRAQAAAAFRALVGDTRELKRSALAGRGRANLLRAALRARRLSRRRPCAAVRTLRRYRRLTGKLGPGPRTQLRADALKATVALMQLPGARRCGGGRAPRAGGATTTVLESSARRLRLRIALPAPTFVGRRAGGATYEEMFMEGLGETGVVGRPGLPTMTKFFGVPTGADVSVKLGKTQGYEVKGVNLFPHQESPVDGREDEQGGVPPPATFEDPPFEIDRSAYRSDARYPRAPTEGGALGSMHGLRIGGADITGGRYRPKSKTLEVFTSVDVTVQFGGDNKGTFGRGHEVGGRWNVFFSQNYGRLIENAPTVAENLDFSSEPIYCGQDILVVSGPEYAEAVAAFRAAKEAEGYLVSHAFTGAGPGQIGTTPEQIQTYIRQQMNEECLADLQFVVLIGNVNAVPTFLKPCYSAGGDIEKCDVATDLPYSLDGNGDDLFADVMLGRIPATDPANALAVVNKIVGYQTTPPAPEGDDFYRHATATGYFQQRRICVLNEGQTGEPNCDPDDPPVTGHKVLDLPNHKDARGFTWTSNRINTAMKMQGYTVDRLWTKLANPEVIPEQYYNGTDIPPALRLPTFPWNSNTTNFLDAYNEGRFLILHRGHGGRNSWADPDLSSGHVSQMTNGTKLPVVFGVNCLSGNFDNPADPSFVEEQVQKVDGGGAVAGFGDTRVSPTHPNNHMARGFFDALFPDTEPEFGSEEPTRRLGDVLLSGKAFMASMQGFDGQGSGDTHFEHHLYHLLGDPTTQMWAKPPRNLDLTRIVSQYRAIARAVPGDPAFQVAVQFPTGAGGQFAPGSIATLMQNGKAVGRAVVGSDGKATVTPENDIAPQDLTVALNQQGALPGQDAVDGVPPAASPPPPPPPAPPGPTQTSLTLEKPADVVFASPNRFTGELAPPSAGATIRVVYTRETGAAAEEIRHEATTDANGGFSDDVTFTTSQRGRWRAQAFFDGAPGRTASSSDVVTFSVPE